MALPGITKEQMVEVDRIMMEDYKVPVELMMEHAGHNLARLASHYMRTSDEVIVIAGTGNNGGGGLVAARRLSAWGIPVSVYLPQGKKSVNLTVKGQLDRVERMDIPSADGLPGPECPSDRCLVIDSYIGYGFRNKEDRTTSEVFDYLRDVERLISLDAPSGLDMTTGKSISQITPKATLTIAFVKSGFFTILPQMLGILYICDIGVPTEVYRSKLGLDWSPPFKVGYLSQLEDHFDKDSLQRVRIHREKSVFWSVE